MEEEEYGLGVGAQAWAGVWAWARRGLGGGAPLRPATWRSSATKQKAQHSSSDVLGKCCSGVLAPF